MKKKCMTARRLLAGVLCMGLFSGNVFAAEQTSPQLRTINYEQAVQMALENNNTLDSLAARMEYLQDNKSDLFDGTLRPGNGDNWLIMDSARLRYLNAIHSYTNGIAAAKLNKQITELGISATVKSYFSNIQTNEKSLELLKKNLQIQNQLLIQGSLKEHLGLLSKNDLEKLRRDTEQMEQSVKLLELTISSEYLGLNDILGLKAEDRYLIDNPVKYEPLVMNTDIDTYANGRLSVDLSLEIQELAVDTAKFTQNTVVDSSTAADYREMDYNYDNSEREFANTKKQKRNDIQAAYIQIQQLETTQKTLEADLSKAKTDYEAAKVNFQVGNITQLTLDQVELALQKVESQLQKNMLTHDMMKYSFQHTEVLGGQGK